MDDFLMGILKYAWVLICGLFGWIGRGMWNDIRRNHDDLYAYKIHVAENYIKKDVVDRIHERIDEVSKDIKSILTGMNGKK